MQRRAGVPRTALRTLLGWVCRARRRHTLQRGRAGGGTVPARHVARQCPHESMGGITEVVLRTALTGLHLALWQPLAPLACSAPIVPSRQPLAGQNAVNAPARCHGCYARVYIGLCSCCGACTAEEQQRRKERCRRRRCSSQGGSWAAQPTAAHAVLTVICRFHLSMQQSCKHHKCVKALLVVQPLRGWLPGPALSAIPQNCRRPTPPTAPQVHVAAFDRGCEGRELGVGARRMLAAVQPAATKHRTLSIKISEFELAQESKGSTIKPTRGTVPLMLPTLWRYSVDEEPVVKGTAPHAASLHMRSSGKGASILRRQNL